MADRINNANQQAATIITEAEAYATTVKNEAHDQSVAEATQLMAIAHEKAKSTLDLAAKEADNIANANALGMAELTALASKVTDIHQELPALTAERDALVDEIAALKAKFA